MTQERRHNLISLVSIVCGFGAFSKGLQHFENRVFMVTFIHPEADASL